MNNVIKLDGDPRCKMLTNAIIDLCYARAEGMSIASVLGCLELVKIGLVGDVMDSDGN